MEEKELQRRRDINRFIDTLRSGQKYSDDILKQVRDDLEYGLTEEQIYLYLKKEYGITQIRLLSKCLRDGGKEDFVKLLNQYMPNTNQMQVAADYYEKGVGLLQMEEVLKLGAIPAAMKAALDKILQAQEKAKKEAMSENEYARNLFRQIEEVVAKIAKQDEKYEELCRKLSALAVSVADDEIRQKLADQVETCEKTISNQQDQLNRANAAVVRLRTENENKDREMKRMERRIDTLEERLLQTSGEKTQPAEDGRMDSAENSGTDTGIQAGTFAGIPTAAGGTIPVYYQVPVADRQGNYIRHVQVERTSRKSSGIAAFLGSLCFKKKSRADIVKLVASGDLVPAQLVQIKSAIEKGLTESQLVELINNNVSAEKMKEIIEIAVLENSLA